MDGLVVGVDLCDEYTQISCPESEKTWTIPTVICRNKHVEEWYVAEDAYAHTLLGDGIIVDKLVKLVLKDGTATLGEIRYEAKELLKLYLERILQFPKQEYKKEEISQLVFTVRRLEPKLIRILEECAQQLQIPKEQVHVISHPESFAYYILSQKKELWSGAVGMFDLAEEKLRYYELKVQRGMKQSVVIAEYEELEEGFNLDILKNPSGARLADKILCSCAERLMQKKPYSSVFLTGKGFENRDWAEDFMKLLCTNRRVYMEQVLFAAGAAYRAADYLHAKTSYPFTCICEGHLRSTVSMNVMHKGQETSVVLAAAGDSWYDRVAVLDVIPDKQKSVEFVVTPLDAKKKKMVSIPLEGFPDRPDRTTKVRIQVTFLDEKTMDVRLKDQGFGELFPSSGVQIRQEVML